MTHGVLYFATGIIKSGRGARPTYRYPPVVTYTLGIPTTDSIIEFFRSTRGTHANVAFATMVSHGPFYAKVAALGLVLGAGMELFMIKTGFYSIVTRNEAERWEENRQRAEWVRERVLKSAPRRPAS